MKSIPDKKKLKYKKILWSILLLPAIIFIVIIFLAAIGKMGYMPKIEDLENPKINFATLVISEDNEVLGSIYYKNQNRTKIDFETLPKNLVDALIATEDIRFYRHAGIDVRGLARAIILNGILGNRSAGGGSTITQQTAKQLFHKPPESIFERLKQKIKEWVIAVKLERFYTKEEIIALYFNQYDFLYNAVGIKSASNIYFNKEPSELKTEEAAVLVGMMKNPYLYNPKIHPEKALNRRNTVLMQMEKYDFLSEEISDSLRTLPVKYNYTPSSHNRGLATYFREFLKRRMNASKPKRKDYSESNYLDYVEDSTQWENNPLYGWCNKNKKPSGENFDLYTDGLRIYTTINSKMQVYAEEAFQAHMGGYLQDLFFKVKKGKKNAPFSRDLEDEQIDNILRNSIKYSDRGIRMRNKGIDFDSIYEAFQKPVKMTVFTWKGEKDTTMSPFDSILYYKHLLRAGFIAMEPNTGHVKAYVGGINFKHLKYDHVTQGKRQAGSTFKPFLYILAMQERYTPCDEFPVTPITFHVNDETWTPGSTTKKKYVGTMKTLKWGLALSDNYMSARLVHMFKPKPIADIAHKMGVKSYIDPVPAMIYGTSDVSVEEMVVAYTTLANKGISFEPLYVSRIEDKYGNVLAEFSPSNHEAISEKTAYLMLNLMQGVTRFGTAARLRYRYNFTGEIAGKTGTTNNNSDGWFIGITPKLSAGVWVGGEDRSIHFDRTSLGGGSNMALPIWAEFMKRVYADSSLNVSQEDQFEAPEEISFSLNCKEESDISEERFNYEDIESITED